jgi:hypothetical protein
MKSNLVYEGYNDTVESRSSQLYRPTILCERSGIHTTLCVFHESMWELIRLPSRCWPALGDGARLRRGVGDAEQAKDGQ